LAQLHKAGRQRPGVVAWLDGSTAQQDLIVFPHRNDTDHIARVLIVNGPTVFADVAHAVIVWRHHACQLAATLSAKVLCTRGGKIKRGGWLGHADSVRAVQVGSGSGKTIYA